MPCTILLMYYIRWWTNEWRSHWEQQSQREEEERSCKDALVDGPPGNKFIAYFALNNRYHRNLPQRNSHYNIAFDGVKWMINDRVIWNAGFKLLDHKERRSEEESPEHLWMENKTWELYRINFVLIYYHYILHHQLHLRYNNSILYKSRFCSTLFGWFPL